MSSLYLKKNCTALRQQESRNFLYTFLKSYYGSVNERVGDANTEISSCSSVRKLIYFLLFISEHLVGPCVWVGSSLGNVVLFAASFPPAGDQRQTQPVLTFNTGVALKCFVNHVGRLLPGKVEFISDNFSL